ncbi:MAG: septum formation initiator family protein [Eubacterium sp.]|nr:septum formation initiator family protein [Eubacterium sp.]
MGKDIKMAKVRVKKSNRQSRLALTVVFFMMVVVVVICFVHIARLQEKDKELTIVQNQLESQLEDANNKAVELEEREKYMKTKKYIEDEAKNKLGLVNSDEILIKPKEDDD